MKLSKSHLLTIVTILFVLLYTLYIAEHGRWWYFIKFLFVCGYVFFIAQGMLLRSRNWGILMLLPPAVLAASIAAGYLLVFILRWGGGTLLDADRADMILLALLFMAGSVYGVRLIRGRKARKPGRH